jgi:hypothetical protein
MALRYRIITLFLLVQSIGIACSWLWQHVPADAGVPLWGTGMLLLIPGDFIAAWMVEKSFWRSGLSLASMGILSTLLGYIDIRKTRLRSTPRITRWVIINLTCRARIP